jgi:hypothetical protein
METQLHDARKENARLLRENDRLLRLVPSRYSTVHHTIYRVQAVLRNHDILVWIHASD